MSWTGAQSFENLCGRPSVEERLAARDFANRRDEIASRASEHRGRERLVVGEGREYGASRPLWVVVDRAADFDAVAVRQSVSEDRDSCVRAGSSSHLRTPECATRIAVAHQSVAMYLASRNSSMPWWPPSRPRPDSFTPPKGAAGSETTPRLRPIMPASRRSETRSPRARSCV